MVMIRKHVILWIDAVSAASEMGFNLTIEEVE